MDTGWGWRILSGFAFLAIGALLAFRSVSRDASIRKRQTYALTNHRAIIVSSDWGDHPIASYPITPETEIDFVPGDKATIWFARDTHSDEGARIGFRWIDDGPNVFELMMQVQRGAE
jgi:hypothetical protein